MQPSESRFVPKVHPATRPMESEDPLLFSATPIAGDPEIMLECLVQEYAQMGWNSDQILALFRSPFFPALQELSQHFGEAGLRERVVTWLQRTGVFCCSGHIEEFLEEDEAEIQLVELNIRFPSQSS